MDQPLVISDRLTAVGYRLAGMSTLVTEPEMVAERFREALVQNRPILITAELAASIPPGELQQAVTRASPPVALVTDLSGHVEAPDVTGKLRRALGVDT